MTILTTALWLLLATVVGAIVTSIGMFLMLLFIFGLIWAAERVGKLFHWPRWLNEDTLMLAVIVPTLILVAVMAGIGALNISEAEIGWPDVPTWMEMEE